ncbi:MAG: hypothetical protein LVQ96_08290 [Thermoplasmatales archaeon]|nr:hypothetical protein [Thermoplasmatales archaeon]
MSKKTRLFGISFVVVIILSGFISIHYYNQSSGSSHDSLPVQISYPSGIPLYLVGPAGMQRTLTDLRVPGADIHQTSVMGLQNTGNDSIIFIVWPYVSQSSSLATNLVSTIGSLFARGDLIFVLTGGYNSAVSDLLGVSWANEFHSKVLVMHGVPPNGVNTMIAANGNTHFFALAPINESTISFLGRVSSVFNKFSSVPNESCDPIIRVEGNPSFKGWTFATGEIMGMSNSNGTYRYDLGIFVGDKMTPVNSMPGKMKIPILTMGWESYTPSSTIVNNDGYIENETSNINYISSYNSYLDGWNEPWSPWSHISYNSYFYSSVGYSPTGTSGWITPPRLPSGSMAIKSTTHSEQGTPEPEKDYLWSFSYSQTSANNPYSNGFSSNGMWILMAGTGSTNTAAITMNEKINLVTQKNTFYGGCGSGSAELYSEKIILQDHFTLTYNPGGSWTTSGSSAVCWFNSNYNGLVSGVYYSTQWEYW